MIDIIHKIPILTTILSAVFFVILFKRWESKRRPPYLFWWTLGGLLPGIGGSFTKFGYTEVLYVTELPGIILIYLGYVTMRNDQALSVYDAQKIVIG